MDFAKKILNKYGWKDGEGLGKNNNGIVKPIKAVYKFDTAGLGQDIAASDFNNHWWERVFNEAAENVEVIQEKDGAVSMNAKDDAVEITTKGYSIKKLKRANKKSMRYSNFLQSAALTKAGNEIEDPDKIDISDIAVPKYKVLSDEELFKACGGRTAHKGARHGLKLSGKLIRLEQQEQEMLAKLQKNIAQEDKPQSQKKKSKNSEKEPKPKKSKRRKYETQELDATDVILKKKSKKNKKGGEFSLEDSSAKLLKGSDDDVRNNITTENEEEALENVTECQENDLKEHKKSKKKKKSKV